MGWSSEMKEEAGFRFREVRFDEPGCQWTGTVTFDGAGPYALSFYIWHIEGQALEESLSKLLGYDVVLKDINYGNGHGSGRIARKGN